MVYAYDRITPMPTKDLYDTLLMAMAINAAKDQYDKAERRLDALQEQIGNFYSPFAKDMKWYQNNVEGRIKNTLDDLYARGIDPLRSAEGRAALRQLERSVPKSTITQMKANAALYEKRLEQIAKLGGDYNKAMDIALNGDPQEFSTVGDGGVLNTFDFAPAAAYKDLDQLLEPIVKNVKPSYDEEKTKADTQHRIWTTVSEKRLMDQFNDNLSDILNTPSGKYLLMQSQQEADAINAQNPDARVTGLDVLKQKAANRLKDHVQESFEIDPLYLKQYEANLNYSKWKQQWNYAVAHPKSSGGKSGSGTTGSGGGKIPDSVYDRNRAAMIGKVSGLGGADMATPQGLYVAATRIKPYQMNAGQTFEQQYGNIIRNSPSTTNFINGSPWNGMLYSSTMGEAFDAYKASFAVPLGKELFYAQFGIDARSNDLGMSSLYLIPISDVVANLIAPEDFITNTTGMADGRETHNTKAMRVTIPKDGYIVAQDWAMNPMQKDGRLHEGWWVDIYNSRGNKIGEAVYDQNVVSDYIRKADGEPIVNAGMTGSPVGYVANTAISSESGPVATFRGRNLDDQQKLTNAFDNSLTYFEGPLILDLQPNPNF